MGQLQTLDLTLFTAGAFAAAFVTGLAGFAFAIVAAAVWLHFLPPAQAAALIVGRVRRVGRAIVNWFLTSPSPQAYVRTDTAHESASSRAARIRRNQEMVDELFAEPGPDVSAVNNRGHPRLRGLDWDRHL
jgi:hypothetical protein